MGSIDAILGWLTGYYISSIRDSQTMSKTNFSYSADKARKAKIKKFLLSKKFQYGVAIFVTSGILIGVTTIALQAREESICKTESEMAKVLINLIQNMKWKLSFYL